MAASVAAVAVVVLLLAYALYRAISSRRTARRVRLVEESRQAGTLPADVAHALEQASRRSQRTDRRRIR